jgi:hypothetical protein
MAAPSCCLAKSVAKTAGAISGSCMALPSSSGRVWGQPEGPQATIPLK